MTTATTATSSSYPPPPPYYRLYKDYERDPASAPDPRPPSRAPSRSSAPPTPLTWCCPPSRIRASASSTLRALTSVRLVSSFLHQKELRSLNRELQLHILELADILVERPSQYARKVEDISLIFKNMHHLLNSLRPHQARATLIHILERQIQRRKQAVEDIKKRREEARRLLKESLQIVDGQLR
uniref:Mediator of RNA polymerase II transcription subunit 7 n=1 Tax=Ananas comosus var. bracteatus TaxID=296719 RepID=A0A6V7PT53_ANACO|nr:unnamed protein product [Ananas comosus var. bracteatus]